VKNEVVVLVVVVVCWWNCRIMSWMMLCYDGDDKLRYLC